MLPLAVCTGCSRHVKRGEAACPFCATPLVIDDVTIAPLDESGPRISRSAMLLAGAAMAAGCNLFQSADIYGGPPRPVAEDAPAVMATIYGGPPALFADAAVPPGPHAPAYGLPPPPEPPPPAPPEPPQPDASTPRHDGHAHHNPHASPDRHAVPVPAYGVAPRNPHDL